MDNELRVIISGGGTGGHIFPAVSIANAIRQKRPQAKLLFVGAQDRMEMQRVPAAGYEIVGLPVRGFVRPLWSLKNIGVAIDYLKSKRQVKQTLKEFRPMVAVGVGGYASGATLDAAHAMGIPCLIQEQNSYAGVTNKMLASKAQKICVAYDGMERFFPKEKIIKTGNPVRQNLLTNELTRNEAVEKMGFDPNRPFVLIIGGSLGARTVNESVVQNLDLLAKSDVQVMLQTGKYYFESVKQQIAQHGDVANLKVTDFISDMGTAYRAADLVVSRAGASSISEFCLIGKPVILVPSPNVAEDHQTKNAMALVNRDAALYVKDCEAREKLLPLALQTVADKGRLQSLGANAKQMALPDSANIIADEVLRLAGAI